MTYQKHENKKLHRTNSCSYDKISIFGAQYLKMSTIIKLGVKRSTTKNIVLIPS
jgi:aminoglycoside N3'-acetyltransferase